jgi:hypothetical protein
MKKKLILFSTVLGMGYLALSSYTIKPYFYGYGNCTGSPSTSASCGSGGCHTTSATTTNNGISLVDKVTGAAVTAGNYTPGKVYIATLSGTNSSSLAKFGFQVCVVNSTGTADVGLITATNANSVSDVYTGSAIHILEQKTGPLAGTSGAYSVSFDWTAPAKGTGAVNFYSVINAVNGNGKESGDAVSAKVTSTFSENTTAINESKLNLISKIYPNPASNVLNIEGLSNTKDLTVGIYNIIGQQIMNPTLSQSSIDVSNLSAGIYVLRVSNGTQQEAITFTKQ